MSNGSAFIIVGIEVCVVVVGRLRKQGSKKTKKRVSTKGRAACFYTRCAVGTQAELLAGRRPSVAEGLVMAESARLMGAADWAPQRNRVKSEECEW